jgi:hypothetical protein
MDIERELNRDEEEHLHGKCHLFAIALHRLTGLPLAAMLDVDMWSERTVLVHAYVMNGDQAIDVRGRFPIDTIDQDFEVNDHWDVTGISEEDLMLLGSRRRKVNESGPGYRKAMFLAEGVADACGLLQRHPKAS